MTQLKFINKGVATLIRNPYKALEKRTTEYLEEVVLHLMPIIKYLNEKVKSEVKDVSTYIIDNDNICHTAHL